jgi:hypothetical protein
MPRSVAVFSTVHSSRSSAGVPGLSLVVRRRSEELLSDAFAWSRREQNGLLDSSSNNASRFVRDSLNSVPTEDHQVAAATGVALFPIGVAARLLWQVIDAKQISDSQYC